jgi:hypothetical protein
MEYFLNDVFYFHRLFIDKNAGLFIIDPAVCKFPGDEILQLNG